MTVDHRDGIDWVQADTGGVSTFAGPTQAPGKWWRLPALSYHDGKLLLVWNDHGQHWSWAPMTDMPLADYLAALQDVDRQFVKWIWQ